MKPSGVLWLAIVCVLAGCMSCVAASPSSTPEPTCVTQETSAAASLWELRPGVFFRHDHDSQNSEVWFDGRILLAVRWTAYAICACMAAFVTFCTTACTIVIARMVITLRQR